MLIGRHQDMNNLHILDQSYKKRNKLVIDHSNKKHLTQKSNCQIPINLLVARLIPSRQLLRKPIHQSKIVVHKKGIGHDACSL